MNREIKFRAWDREKKKMTPIFDFAEMCFKGIWDLFPTLENFRPKYVMQYTGLKDKNNKEICEGDIVKAQVGELIWYYLVETSKGFGNNLFYTTRYRNFESTGDESWGTDKTIMGDYYINEGRGLINNGNEIIGNIYEDKELLEDK